MTTHKFRAFAALHVPGDPRRPGQRQLERQSLAVAIGLRRGDRPAARRHRLGAGAHHGTRAARIPGIIEDHRIARLMQPCENACPITHHENRSSVSLRPRRKRALINLDCDFSQGVLLLPLPLGEGGSREAAEG